jgi:Fic family protein
MEGGNMTMTESNVSASFVSNVEELALEELTKLDQIRAMLQGELSQVHDEIKAVKSVLKVIHPKQTKLPAKKSGGRVSRLSDENRALATEFLRDNEDEITAASFQAKFGWSQSTANRALVDMRELGFLRLAGRKGTKHIYRSLV